MQRQQPVLKSIDDFKKAFGYLGLSDQDASAAFSLFEHVSLIDSSVFPDKPISILLCVPQKVETPESSLENEEDFEDDISPIAYVRSKADFGGASCYCLCPVGIWDALLFIPKFDMDLDCEYSDVPIFESDGDETEIDLEEQQEIALFAIAARCVRHRVQHVFENLPSFRLFSPNDADSVLCKEFEPFRKHLLGAIAKTEAVAEELTFQNIPFERDCGKWDYEQQCRFDGLVFLEIAAYCFTPESSEDELHSILRLSASAF